jgi:hypothetical protein
LARGYGALRFAEDDLRGGLALRGDGGSGGVVAMADFYFGFERLLRLRWGNPIYISDFECGGAELRVVADHQAIAGAVEGDYV